MSDEVYSLAEFSNKKYYFLLVEKRFLVIDKI